MYRGETLMGKASRKAWERCAEHGMEDPYFLGMAEVISIFINPYEPNIKATVLSIVEGNHASIEKSKTRKLKRRKA